MQSLIYGDCMSGGRGRFKMKVIEFFDYFKYLNCIVFTDIAVMCFDCEKFINPGQKAYIFFGEAHKTYAFCCQDCFDKFKEEYDEFVNIF